MMITFVLVLLFSTVSCRDPEVTESSGSPTPVLYDTVEGNAALYSGNLLYGQSIVSDGTSIYYISKDGLQLIKNNIDDSPEVVISSKTPYALSYSDGYIFFISGTSGGPIFKVDTEGTGETMITDSQASYLIADPDNVFFLGAQDNLLYRIALDGSKKTLLYPGKVSRIMLIGNILYFIPADETNKVYSLTSGQIATMVSGSSIPASAMRSYDLRVRSESVNIYDDTFFYTDESNSGIYMMPFNGKSKPLLRDTVSYPFIVNGGYVYFTDPDKENRLYRFSIEEPDRISIVVNDKVFRFAVFGNSVFYYRELRYAIYRVSVSGGMSEKVA